jgi:PAS domain-containing protein
MADITKIDTFIQRSPHPAWLSTPQGYCVYANPALERVTGLNSDQINQADPAQFPFWKRTESSRQLLESQASMERSFYVAQINL